jgi:hypothetical protein
LSIEKRPCGSAFARLERERIDLLANHGPLRFRARQVVEEPLLLLRAHHRPGRIQRFGAVRMAAVAARLIRSPLPRIEDAEIDEVAELQSAIQRMWLPDGNGAGAQRHRLVVGLIGGCAAEHEDLGGVPFSSKSPA